MKKPIILTIMDGFGLAEAGPGNAISQANLPNIDMLMSKYNSKEMYAAGENVGLPDGQMGNSEVGHLNIGAGRIVNQSLVLINKAVEDGSIFENEKLVKAATMAKENGGNLHVLGLLSDGGVHSHINHFKAMLDLADKNGMGNNTLVHAFLDGRDVAPKSAIKYLDEINSHMSETGSGKLASISGRFYAMDRDNRWERVERAYNAVVRSKDANEFSNYEEYINSQYDKDIIDEFIEPAISSDSQAITDKDVVIFINFRPDRAIELSKAMTMENFDGFDVSDRPNIKLACMMRYSDDVQGAIVFAPQNLENTLGDFLSEKNYKQLRIAETEKYPHVTFFFDGGVDKEIEGSTRVLINSPKVETYDMQPEMSAPEVTKKCFR